MVQTTPPLTELYLADETAWLDAMVELIGAGAFAELDFANLREYLQDMARRDRREVLSRLTQLLLHVLKWEFQPAMRSSSWKRSIALQRRELNRDVESGVLRNHAESCLAEAYRDAVEDAAAESGIPASVFPTECPYSLDELLTYEAVE